MKPIRVVVVDDSAVMRIFLRDALSSTNEIEVVGSARDPFAARDLIKRLNPDVLTLDILMPNMDGLDFLERLMRLRPLPVVMFSGLTHEGSTAALQALAKGAVDFVVKPSGSEPSLWNDAVSELISKIKFAATARLQPTVQGEPVLAIFLQLRIGPQIALWRSAPRLAAFKPYDMFWERCPQSRPQS